MQAWVDISLQVSKNVLISVDNILRLPKMHFRNSSQEVASILHSLSTLTETLQETVNQNFTYSGTNIMLASVKVERDSFPLVATFRKDSIGHMERNRSFDFQTSNEAPAGTEDLVSVSLPEAILAALPGKL